MQAFPHFRTQVLQPKIVTCRGHYKQDDQRKKTQNLERKATDFRVLGVGQKNTYDRIHVSKRMELNDAENAMRGSKQKHCNTQVPAIVQQRQKRSIQPTKRANHEYQMKQNDRYH
jgi:hypothetical protein